MKRSRPALWLGAFTGFYRPGVEEIRALDPVSKFLYAGRSVILVISAQAAIAAGLLAAADRRFDPIDFALVLAGFVAAHLLSNLSNDYFGYVRGHDTPDSPRMRYTVHPLASGVIEPRALVTGVVILAALGLGILAYFVLERGGLAVAFAAAGIALLLLYDAAPVPLKSIGLGERAARGLNAATVLLIYAVIAPLIAWGRLTPFAVLVAFALPRAARAVALMARPRQALAPPGFVGWPLWVHRACLEHNRLFGWLYILGLAAGAAWPEARA